jgi:hypothetical protein
MASGTVIPVPKMQFFDNNGAALAGGKLYCYASGTTTHQAVYSDAALTSALSQPVTLDSSGRATIFLQAKAYKFTLKTSADVELWTQDNVFALQPSESMNLELTGTAGETLAANNVVYLSDGSGSKTAGRWYKADADNTYSSTEPKIGLATAAISTGATGLIRIGGTMDGFSSLTLGAKQYVSATAGALTETAPTNAKVVGWAMSATEVVIDPESMANSLAQTFKVMASSPYNLTWPAADASGLIKSNGSGVMSFVAGGGFPFIKKASLTAGRFESGTLSLAGSGLLVVWQNVEFDTDAENLIFEINNVTSSSYKAFGKLFRSDGNVGSQYNATFTYGVTGSDVNPQGRQGNAAGEQQSGFMYMTCDGTYVQWYGFKTGMDPSALPHLDLFCGIITQSSITDISFKSTSGNLDAGEVMFYNIAEA